jgi:predicted lipoprotein with Yx(FWY)xxD motif
MKGLVGLLVAAVALAACSSAQAAGPASAVPASRSIWVDRTHQQLYAFEGDRLVMQTACSTAGHSRHWAPGDNRYEIPSTPLGSYRIFSKETDHLSRAYQVHMRYALFYDGGRAIHATQPSLYRQLGRPASGGCVRLTRRNALNLFQWAHVGDPVYVVRSVPAPLMAIAEAAHPHPIIVRRPNSRGPGMSTFSPGAKPVFPDQFEHQIVVLAAEQTIEPDAAAFSANPVPAPAASPAP